ncbi:MAG: dTDP-4-dehydrorhamnose 3,5-epimerase family protein [Deltaproteobacteria bacterium]|nr:dTDP-4-dehydrorhamnose 3,5-epimerase family protein [Deltaproteobacteria bacterium]
MSQTSESSEGPAVVGLHATNAKRSVVDGYGRLRVEPIDGLRFRLTRPVPHEDGHVIEVARTDWEIVSRPIVQVHVTTTFPGRVRAWGLHRHATDRLFVAAGLVDIVCYDGRLDSPTYGWLNQFTFSDRNPGLLVVPPNVYHGWKNIDVTEAIVINMPTSLYDHDHPDAVDLPYESPDAPDIVPFRW